MGLLLILRRRALALDSYLDMPLRAPIMEPVKRWRRAASHSGLASRPMCWGRSAMAFCVFLSTSRGVVMTGTSTCGSGGRWIRGTV